MAEAEHQDGDLGREFCILGWFGGAHVADANGCLRTRKRCYLELYGWVSQNSVIDECGAHTTDG